MASLFDCDDDDAAIIITGREVGVLVEWLPIWLLTTKDMMPSAKRETMMAMHLTMIRLFSGSDEEPE